MMATDTVQAFRTGLMEPDTKANGGKTKQMGLENSGMPMEIPTKDSGKTTRQMDTESMSM